MKALRKLGRYRECFEREYLGMPCAPTEEELKLRELAEKYHALTEEYDRKVCTGPIIRGAVMPANGREFVAINTNARSVRAKLWLEVRKLGFSSQQWQEEISKAARRARQKAKDDAR